MIARALYLARRFAELPSAVSELAQELRRLSQQSAVLDDRLSTLVREVRHPKPIRGQLLLLWPAGNSGSQTRGSPTDDEPGCVAKTVTMTSERQRVVVDNIYWPVPAGAWLIGIGVEFSAVSVGNECQDLGAHSRGQALRLRSSITPGVQLSVVIEAVESSL